MASPNQEAFNELWPRCFINFMAVIEVIAVILLLFTELCNVLANFWITNVFAGGWCGLIMLIHAVLSFVNGCCSPGPKTAFRAVFVAIIGLIACTALISFDATFLSRPTTCLLTTSCVTAYSSNATFSVSLEQSFFAVFNKLSPFQNYGESQAKFLFQAIQLGIGVLCFLICLLYTIIYYACSSKAKQQVGPTPLSDEDQKQKQQQQQQQPGYFAPQQQQQPDYFALQQQPGYFAPQQQPFYAPPPPLVPIQSGYQPAPSVVPNPAGYQLPPALVPAQQGYYPSPPSAQQGYYPSPPLPPSVQQNVYAYQPVAPAWQPPPHVPQPLPGVIPWNANRRF